MRPVRAFRQTCITALVVSAALIAAAVAAAHEDVIATTDDTRRIPIPPHDYSEDPIFALRGGTLISGAESATPGRAFVVIQGDRILYAGAEKNFEAPQHPMTVIDTSGLFIMPGLIDLHIHFTARRRDDAGQYRDSDAAAAIRGMLLLDQLLDAGVTTVRDTGTRDDVALRLKEAVERGLVDGPRILWSGQRIVTRGGHGDEIVSVGSGRPKSMAVGSRERLANGPWEWRLAVREQIRRHADWIKLTAPYTKAELVAAVEEAHMHDIPVAVDSFGKYSLWAAEAGVDSIEHPLDLTEETIDAMAESDTGLVPTLTTFYNVIEHGYPSIGVPAGGFYYTMSRRFPVNHEQHLEVVEQANSAGIRIGVGTDIPVQAETRYPESYYTELAMLKDAGLSDEEVLASATYEGASILRMPDKLGTIEAGMLADILVVAEDPRMDIQNVRSVRLVIADGKIVRSHMAETIESNNEEQK